MNNYNIVLSFHLPLVSFLIPAPKLSFPLRSAPCKQNPKPSPMLKLTSSLHLLHRLSSKSFAPSLILSNFSPKPLVRSLAPRFILKSLSASLSNAPQLSIPSGCFSHGELEPYLSCCMPSGRRLRIAVLVSGGVDSSVALRLLHAAGHSCTAFYLKIWFQVCSLIGLPDQVLVMYMELHISRNDIF